MVNLILFWALSAFCITVCLRGSKVIIGIIDRELIVINEIIDRELIVINEIIDRELIVINEIIDRELIVIIGIIDRELKPILPPLISGICLITETKKTCVDFTMNLGRQIQQN